MLNSLAYSLQTCFLLGMTGYSSRFVKGYSDKIQPLRQLTHQDTKWVWEKQHDDAFEEIKKILATRPTLAYFDPRKKTTLTVDASPTGLGGILSQQDDRGEVHVVAYASKALSDVETRYSQTEREALAVIWACEHYHLYLYGQPVTVLTDHLPLLGMINKPGAKLSARVERWVLRLQPYDVTLKYQKGADNPADYMSRHQDKSATSTRATKVAEDYVNFLADESKPLALVKEKIITETQSDKTLQSVIKAVKTGRWTDTDVKPYFNVRNELSITQDGIVLRGCRICIPQSQQDQAVQLAHQGHQGITKTKSLIREKVWFPGIDKMVEDRVKRCLPCQSTTTKTTREPLQMTNITRPGEEVSVDFADVGNGQYLLIVVDDFSRYPEVEIISSLTAKVVIH